MAVFESADDIVYGLKAEITLLGGRTITIAPEDIQSYSPSGTMSSQVIPLGVASAMNFSLGFNNENYGLKSEDADGAKVHVYASEGADGTAWKDFGVWYVTSSEFPEQSSFATISGADAMETKLGAVWKDAKADYPRTLRLMMQTVCAAAGIELATPNFRNAGYTQAKLPEWPADCALRDVIGYVAACAAGFARINYAGKLEIRTLGETASHQIGPDYYFEFSRNGGFEFNCLQYKFETGADENEPDFTRFAIDGSLSDNAANTVQMQGNPLMTQQLANDIAQALHGIAYEGASLGWFGSPDVLPGDEAELTDTKGEVHRLILNAHSMTLDGGIKANSASDMPMSLSETEGFSSGGNAFNSDGTINVEAISGLDRKVVSASTGYFENLTGENVKASKLIAAALQATELWAKSITASEIKTDILVAAMGTLVTLAAGTATFDRASAENLVANLFNLTGEGVMEDVFIHNLKVAYAQVVSASIGNLVLQSSDGRYYQIDVDGDGNVSATPVEPSDEEKEAGVFGGTRPIIATTMTVDEMNASGIKAVHMLVNKIDAARIDVDQLFAREAFVTALTTTDISSNSYIQQSIRDISTGEIETYVRLQDDGLHIGEAGKASEMLIDEGSANVVVSGQTYSTFAANYVQFGNYQIRKTADGGMAFKMN